MVVGVRRWEGGRWRRRVVGRHVVLSGQADEGYIRKRERRRWRREVMS